MTVHQLHPAGIDPAEALQVRGWLEESDDLRYRAAQAMEAESWRLTADAPPAAPRALRAVRL